METRRRVHRLPQVGTGDWPLPSDRRADLHDPGARRQSCVGPDGCAEYPNRRSRQQSDGEPLRSAAIRAQALGASAMLAAVMAIRVLRTHMAASAITDSSEIRVLRTGLGFGLWILGLGI